MATYITKMTNENKQLRKKNIIKIADLTVKINQLLVQTAAKYNAQIETTKKQIEAMKKANNHHFFGLDDELLNKLKTLEKTAKEWNKNKTILMQNLLTIKQHIEHKYNQSTTLELAPSAAEEDKLTQLPTLKSCHVESNLDIQLKEQLKQMKSLTYKTISARPDNRCPYDDDYINPSSNAVSIFVVLGSLLSFAGCVTGYILALTSIPALLISSPLITAITFTSLFIASVIGICFIGAFYSMLSAQTDCDAIYPSNTYFISTNGEKCFSDEELKALFEPEQPNKKEEEKESNMTAAALLIS